MTTSLHIPEDVERVEYVCPRCDATVASEDTACPRCGQAFDLGPERNRSHRRRLAVLARPEVVAVGLLATGPVVVFAGELSTDGPPDGRLIAFVREGDHEVGHVFVMRRMAAGSGT